MAIRRYIEDAAIFEPEAVKVLTTAFDDVCTALGLRTDAARDREAIAVRIIELARSGVLDAAALRDRVLLESRALA